MTVAPAHAFPPYRSTDADTAAPWALEARVGLLRLRRNDGDNVYSSPLLRLNLGVPRALELVSELEVRPGNGGLTDAAVGAKWVPVRGRWSIGNETLFLVPVSNTGGAGVESQIILTFRDDSRGLRVHLNAGGFHDGRPEPTERGWRASILGELRRGRYRPGVELFARKIGAAPMEILIGPGVIIAGGGMDVRFGLHFALTESAPDFILDLWGSREFSVR